MAAFFAGVPTSSTTVIETLTAFLHLATEGIRVDALNAIVSAIGPFTAAGTIAPSGALNFNMLLKLKRSTTLVSCYSITAAVIPANTNAPPCASPLTWPGRPAPTCRAIPFQIVASLIAVPRARFSGESR